MSLCPEAAYHDSLSDDEFWEWAFHGRVLDDVDFEPDEDQIAEFDGYTVNTCTQCGRRIAADEYDDAAEMIEARVIVCDECVNERFPYADEDEAGTGMVLISPSPWEQAWMYEQYLERTAA